MSPKPWAAGKLRFAPRHRIQLSGQPAGISRERVPTCQREGSAGDCRSRSSPSAGGMPRAISQASPDATFTAAEGTASDRSTNGSARLDALEAADSTEAFLRPRAPVGSDQPVGPGSHGPLEGGGRPRLPCISPLGSDGERDAPNQQKYTDRPSLPAAAVLCVTASQPPTAG